MLQYTDEVAREILNTHEIHLLRDERTEGGQILIKLLPGYASVAGNGALFYYGMSDDKLIKDNLGSIDQCMSGIFD